MQSSLLYLWLALANAQDQDVGGIVDDLTQAPEVAPAAPSDPWEAFAQGDYGGALEGFLERQIVRPRDAEALMNVGAAQYSGGDYDAAATTFARAAALGDDDVRAEAMYNLGNTAYRSGKLDEAIHHYQAALDVDPDDGDAKFNLEYVRDEIRRRQEEAQDREDQQGQEPPPDGDPNGDGEPDPGDGQSDPSQDQDPDSDGDGLSDTTETEGDNPTDPDNPDTDSDGIPDGEEDRNHNGRLDEGETDPRNPDSDGDGIPDGEDDDPAPDPQDHPGNSPDPGEMDEEEAMRYLQALEEGRPDPERPPEGEAVAVPGGKDW